MELDTARARKRIGEEIPFDLTSEIGQTRFGARTLRFLAPVRASGTVVYDGKSFRVAGSAETVFASVCARCNEPFQEPFACTFSERFVKPDERDAESDDYTFEGSTLQIQDAVMDNILLALPLISVCRADCRGLCPVCGVDWNERACACKAEEKRNPFSVLETLGTDG